MRAALALCLLLFSSLASAQATCCSVIRIYIAYTNGGASEAIAQYGSLDEANRVFMQGLGNTLTNSGVNTIPQLVGSSFGRCCGSSSGIADAVKWAAGDIRLMSERDTAGADVVMVATDKYDNTGGDTVGMGYAAAIGATLPEQGVAGFNVAAMYDEDVFSHEFGHLLGAEHAQGFSASTGTSADACELWTTVDAGGPLPTQISYPGYCWGTNSGQCYGSGAAAVRGNAPPGYTCTYSGGTLSSPTTWDEFMSCPGWGGTEIHAQRYSASTIIFTCPNSHYIQQFSNPNVMFNSVPSGTSSQNNAARMNLMAPTVAGFHSTRIAPRLIAEVISVVWGQ